MAVILTKQPLFNSVADAVYKEIISNSSRYYYFLGKTLAWTDENDPPVPVDNPEYESEVRRNIIFTKEILPTDVSFVVDRINWTSGTVYDNYDDQYSDQVLGIDLSSGGVGYVSPTVVISGGGGSNATATATVVGGVITDITLVSGGSGFTSAPNVIISGAPGTGAVATAVINRTISGHSNLQSASFYVMTDDYNVYKCINNNKRAASTVKPSDVTPDPINTSDGYIWKYMYTVPPALRNKFLTLDQIPVVTAVKQPFYSSGEIKNILIKNNGDGYTSAGITVQGDGYLEADPYFITSANIIAGGNGYSYANVTIAAPISTSASWSSNTTVYYGQRYIHNNNIYQALRTGITGYNAPVHTSGYYENGTTAFEFLGTKATGNAVITSNVITGITFSGGVREINLSTGGTGYVTAPTVNISGGGGANAAAYATLSGTTVNKIVITNAGYGYTSEPTVTFGTAWTANANVTLNQQVYSSSRLYTVTTAGMFGTTAPTHTSNTATNGTANLTYAGTIATGSSVLRFGAGYTSAPTLTITGNGANANVQVRVTKSEASITPLLSNGQLTSFMIENGGIGYSFADLTVTGDGANAEITADLSQGSLNTLQANNELLAENGAIYVAKLVSGGYGYSTANAIITGDGSGAAASVTISNGRVTDVTITNPGTGYTKATITITGNGFGAKARAIHSPYGGHGKNAISELFSRSLAFYNTLSREKNQGIVINNDYRQFGIIKDIKSFNNDKFFAKTTGSGCWLITASSDTTSLAADTICTRTTDNKRFIVVASTATAVLMQAIDGGYPETGDIMTTPSSSSFTITNVTDPDIDRFSGSLLYIDNRQAFNTTREQAVSIKTVFKY